MLESAEAKVLAVYRLAARCLDLQLAILACFGVLAWVGEKRLEMVDLRWFFLFLPIGLGLDAVACATLGTTPGRWWLRLEVVDGAGRRPSFGALLWRNAGAWVLGVGCGVPPFNAVALLLLYLRLRRGKPARYDLRPGLVVRRTRPLEPGRERAFALGLLAVTLCSLYGVAGLVEAEMRRLLELP